MISFKAGMTCSSGKLTAKVGFRSRNGQGAGLLRGAGGLLRGAGGHEGHEEHRGHEDQDWVGMPGTLKIGGPEGKGWSQGAGGHEGHIWSTEAYLDVSGSGTGWVERSAAQPIPTSKHSFYRMVLLFESFEPLRPLQVKGLRSLLDPRRAFGVHKGIPFEFSRGFPAIRQYQRKIISGNRVPAGEFNKRVAHLRGHFPLLQNECALWIEGQVLLAVLLADIGSVGGWYIRGHANAYHAKQQCECNSYSFH